MIYRSTASTSKQYDSVSEPVHARTQSCLHASHALRCTRIVYDAYSRHPDRICTMHKRLYYVLDSCTILCLLLHHAAYTYTQCANEPHANAWVWCMLAAATLHNINHESSSRPSIVTVWVPPGNPKKCDDIRDSPQNFLKCRTRI